jgi:hypothetical protein
VTRQLLNGPRPGSAHRQVRAERVSEDVDATISQVRTPSCPPHQSLNETLRQRTAISIAEHPVASEMAMRPESCGETNGERDKPHSAPLCGTDMALPLGSLHAELTFGEVHTREKGPQIAQDA